MKLIIQLSMSEFNYINISLASASTRLKEIGVRKVMGSSRQQIIWQFIVENVYVTNYLYILNGMGRN